jgi:acetylornithine deacetylase
LSVSPGDLEAVDAAVARCADDAVAFLERLVAAPSTVAQEQKGQEVVAEELERLGFTVDAVPIPDAIADEPAAGIPQRSYEDRFDIVGTMGGAAGPTLLLNGHIDVVPADEPELWSTPPFVPRVFGGRLYGRGAGDMKGGFAMATLALDAILTAVPGAIAGRLTFVSVIEEECTGNGTLAAGRAGYVADAVILPEPTGLELLLAGVGILWLDIAVDGEAAHAQSADRAVNAIDASLEILGALKSLERSMNEHLDDPAMHGVVHPYNVNVGMLRAGDWASSVPARARLGVRVGHPTTWTAEQAEDEVRRAIEEVSAGHPWLQEHPPQIRPSGFRAQGYALTPDHPLVERVSSAHASAHGALPAVQAMASTTDARYYLNQFDTPALCYGPKAHHIHGIDESVELDSIVAGARTLARFLLDWYAGSGTEPAP